MSPGDIRSVDTRFNGLYRGSYRDSGKENGNYCNGFYRGYIGLVENENGTYYNKEQLTTSLHGKLVPSRI